MQELRNLQGLFNELEGILNTPLDFVDSVTGRYTFELTEHRVPLVLHRVYGPAGEFYLGVSQEDGDWFYDREVELDALLAPLKGVHLTWKVHGKREHFQGYGGVDPDPRIVRLVEGAGLEKAMSTMRHHVYRLKRGVLRILRVGPEAGRAVEIYLESITTQHSHEATVQLDLMRQDVALFNTIKRSLV